MVDGISTADRHCVLTGGASFCAAKLASRGLQSKTTVSILIPYCLHVLVFLCSFLLVFYKLNIACM